MISVGLLFGGAVRRSHHRVFLFFVGDRQRRKWEGKDGFFIVMGRLVGLVLVIIHKVGFCVQVLGICFQCMMVNERNNPCLARKHLPGYRTVRHMR